MAKIVEKALIGQKVGMSRFVNQDGLVIPVTLVKIPKQRITKVLTPEKNGYHGVQIGYLEKTFKRLTKADSGRLKASGVEEPFSRFQEFRTAQNWEHLALGTQLTASLFEGVQSVDVTGTTKGRGFQGAVKRWGSRIGRKSHGSHFHRRPGSLGSNTTPGRVVKGKHQPGHMGVDQRTIKNLKIIEINEDHGFIVLKGSIPGFSEGYLELRPTNKR